MLLLAFAFNRYTSIAQYKQGDLKSKPWYQLGAAPAFLSWLHISTSFWGRKKQEKKVKISALGKVWKLLSVNEWWVIIITLIIAIIYQALLQKFVLKAFYSLSHLILAPTVEGGPIHIPTQARLRGARETAQV